MDYQEIIEKIKPELEKTINYLQGELAKMRTSRPCASLVEDIQVEVFGKKLPLKSLGLITLTENQEVIIQPWDTSYLEPIEKAIFKSPLQITPMIEKDRIRICFPPLSKEARKNLALYLSQKKENARKTVRYWRMKAWKEIQERYRQGEISEDDKYRAKDKLQDLIDEYQEKIEEMVERKKKEIMES